MDFDIKYHIMKKGIFFLLFIYFSLSNHLFAQDFNPNCDGERFLQIVFPDEPEMTTVKYGENITIAGNFQELYMDIFEPAGDEASLRPVLMFAFGGSFVNGDRTAVHDICKLTAKKGFVTVALDYRLYDRPFPPNGPLPDSLAMMDVVMKAVADYKAAIRFLRKDASTDNAFRIDPDFIFTGGFSAGSIASLHTACLDADEMPEYLLDILENNGGIEGNTDDPMNSNLAYSSEVQGMVNFFGALHKKEFIDANDPPFISIHGDADGIVPYGHGFAVVVILPIITVDGSGELHPRAESLGIKNELITVPGGGHGDFTAYHYVLMEERTNLFLGEILCGDLSFSENISVIPDSKLFPNPASDHVILEFGKEPGLYDVSISDLNGNVIYMLTDKRDQQLILDSVNFKKGLYIVNVNFHDKNLMPINKKIWFK